jgi:uncharacterized protein (DUF58 family)
VIPLLPSEPALRRLERLRLQWRAVPGGSTLGSRRALRHGQSREFHGLRPYEVGDDVRDLDWAATLRFDRPYVRQYHAEVPASLLLLVDASASMTFGEPSKLAYARALGCALGYLAIAHHDRVGALCFGDRITRRLPAGRGSAQWSALRELVGTLEGGGRTVFTDVPAETRRLGGLRGVALILSDFSPPDVFGAGLARLGAGPLSVVAVHILSPQELAPDLGGDLELADLETGDTRSGWIGDAERDRYQAALAMARTRTEQMCRDTGARYVPVSTAIPIVRCLQENLVVAGVLRRGGT